MTDPNEIRPLIRPTIRLRGSSDTDAVSPRDAAGRDVRADDPNASEGWNGSNPNGLKSRSIHSSDEFGMDDPRFERAIAGEEFFEAGQVRTPDQVRKSEVIAAVRAIENKSTGGFTKFIVLLVSLAVFVAAGVAWWDPWVVSMLVIVLLFHEAGHYVAMQVFGYRNVKMFFIPFLGAAVSGRHFNISGWKKALVYLAGPVPGIIVSLPLMACGIGFEQQWMFELGGMGLLLNTLNLLPIMPLDGGWIMHLTVFSRSPFLELVARLLGIASMFAFAYFSGSRFILFIAIPLVLSLSTTYQVAKLIGRLRDRALPQPERDEIPDAAIRLLDDEIQTTPLAPTTTLNRAGIIVQMYESLIVRPLGLGATLAIWTIYGGAFLIAIVGGLAIFVSRDLADNGLFGRKAFESVEHHVPLDVEDTEFHLGDASVEQSYLAVAKFESPEELDAAQDRLAAMDLENYSHARFGDVWIASIPDTGVGFDLGGKRKWEEMAENDLADEADVREQIREMIHPIEPTETWVGDLVAGSVDLCVISGLHHSSIRIRTLAPSAGVAESVSQDSFQMPGIGGSRWYLPPWSPLDTPTPKQMQCRNVVKRLIDGITPATAPELWKQRKKIADEQMDHFRGGGRRAEASAGFAKRLRDLQTQHTHNVINGLEGDQAEVAEMYQNYQTAALEFEAAIDRRAVEIEQRTDAGESIELADDSNDEDYPLMDDYLIDDSDLLGFADPSRRSYHFAGHVTGTVVSTDDLIEEEERRAAEAIMDKMPADIPEQNTYAIEDGGRVLDLFVHHATDQAATVSSVIAFLTELGFDSFELRYVTPTGELD